MGRSEAVMRVILSVTGQNSSEKHCKKGDVQMTEIKLRMKDFKASKFSSIFNQKLS